MFGNIRRLIFKLFPLTCLLCGHYTRGHNICVPCEADLPKQDHACFRCAQLLLNAEPRHACGLCLASPPAFDRTFALFSYQTPIVELITALKFQHKLPIAQMFGELLARKIKTEWYKNAPLPEIIIPMPLHAVRMRERGFNQAIEIAKPIQRELGLTIDFDGIRRIKATKAQSSLLATERKKNIAQAFWTSRSYAGLHVAVVDDVVTTGLTVGEISSVFRRSGAKRIDIWCCARVSSLLVGRLSTGCRTAFPSPAKPSKVHSATDLDFNRVFL